MSSAKSASDSIKSAWLWNHYDPGEIRTESAMRPSPPEKKNGWRIRGEPKSASKKSKAPNMNIFVVWICQPPKF